MTANEVIANELRSAFVRMTPLECALADELIGLAGEVLTVAELLATLAETDPERAALLEPLIYALSAAGRKAVGVHAAVVGELNGAVSH